jgi:cytochrome c oxidase cbb3-type subunit 3
MQDVSSYILTLQGTNPPNPKAPQGEIWSETGAAPATNDSTLVPSDTTQTVVDTTVQTTSL